MVYVFIASESVLNNLAAMVGAAVLRARYFFFFVARAAVRFFSVLICAGAGGMKAAGSAGSRI